MRRTRAPADRLLSFWPEILRGSGGRAPAKRQMQELDILIEDPRWTALDLENLCARAIDATLSHLALDPRPCTLAVLACDDSRMAVLNGDFRDKPTATNVLSWPAEERSAMRPGTDPARLTADHEGLIPLGDIALGYDTCAAEAEAAGKPFADHVTHLVVHGILHLLGYDHTRAPDAALMEGHEVKILGKLGVSDPYRSD